MKIPHASILDSIYANSALCSILADTPLLHAGHSRMLTAIIGEASARLAQRLAPYLADVDFSDTALALEFRPAYGHLERMLPQLRMAIVYDVVALALEAADRSVAARYSALATSITDTLASLATVTAPLRLRPHRY